MKDVRLPWHLTFKNMAAVPVTWAHAVQKSIAQHGHGTHEAATGATYRPIFWPLFYFPLFDRPPALGCFLADVGAKAEHLLQFFWYANAVPFHVFGMTVIYIDVVRLVLPPAGVDAFCFAVDEPGVVQVEPFDVKRLIFDGVLWPLRE